MNAALMEERVREK